MPFPSGDRVCFWFTSILSPLRCECEEPLVPSGEEVGIHRRPEQLPTYVLASVLTVTKLRPRSCIFASSITTSESLGATADTLLVPLESSALHLGKLLLHQT